MALTTKNHPSGITGVFAYGDAAIAAGSVARAAMLLHLSNSLERMTGE
ncbi:MULTISPECIES: hypothetical protein [unclassified Pseudomonas]|nr:MULTISPECIES: hypothetical protein [unclassified Pseudomonas]